jgi:hypothetical protein
MAYLMSSIRTKLAQIEQAAIAAAATAAGIACQIEARRGRDGIEELIEHGMRAQEHAANLLSTTERMKDWLKKHPEQLTAIRIAPAHPMTGETLISAIRRWRQRIIELKESVLAAERAEESLVEQALAAGQYILRRHDADPRAILGCALSTISREKAA